MNFVLGWCKNRCWKLLAIHSAPPDFRKPAVCCRVKVRFARNVLGGKHQARLGPKPSSHPPMWHRLQVSSMSHGQNWGVTYRGWKFIQYVYAQKYFNMWIPPRVVECNDVLFQLVWSMNREITIMFNNPVNPLYNRYVYVYVYIYILYVWLIYVRNCMCI